MVSKPDSLERDFSKVLYDYQRIIYKVSKTYRDNNEDQEDLFQEIVYQLWKSFQSFKGESKISSWIYRIALNTAIAIYRKPKLQVHYMEKLPEPVHPGETQKISEKEHQLFKAIRTLSDTEKAIVSLFLEGFSYKEIAAITGVTESNTGVRLNRIKTKLKKLLK